MKIESYRFGSIAIDGRTYTDDVIVYPDRVDGDWWREEGHLLQQVDVEQVLGAGPEVIVVGTGAYGRMRIADGLQDTLEERGIELIAARTEHACKRYNEIADERRAIAALHLTC